MISAAGGGKSGSSTATSPAAAPTATEKRSRRLPAKLRLRRLRGTIPRTELPPLVPQWATGALSDYRHSQAA
ncbi:hypothetical protein ACWEQN_25455 [Streptomyces sp. NPDC004129]